MNGFGQAYPGEWLEHGDRAIEALRYENAKFYLDVVPLNEVLRRRYERGVRTSSAPVAKTGTTAEGSGQWSQTAGGGETQPGDLVRVNPVAPSAAEDAYSYAEQDKHAAALRDIRSPIFASWEVGQEYDFYEEIEAL